MVRAGVAGGRDAMRDALKTILLVEDNADDVELTLRAFHKQRVANEMIVARDGEEALNYLFATGPFAGRDAAVLPQLVLLDLNLPKVDGMEVLRRMRADARTRHLPVVILTSSTERRDVAGTYALGANSYVRKPVDFSEFVSVAGQLGLYWLVLNQPPPVEVR